MHFNNLSCDQIILIRQFCFVIRWDKRGISSSVISYLKQIVFPLYCTGVANGSVKKWTPNVDFEDPVNWDANRVPSSVDVTVFQEDTAVPIVVPAAGINVCEMVLPVNGQMVLEPNAEIIISASSKDTGGCTGQSEFSKIIIIAISSTTGNKSSICFD